MVGLKIFLVVILSIGYEYLVGVNSHGMMMDPVSRNSRWRVDKSAIINYDDNALYCGGYAVHWSAYAGKCGVCGDSYGDEKPRPHELGGTYGQGTIVKKYKAGQEIEVSIKITKSHRGYFVFQFCNFDSQQETEECYMSQTMRVKGGVEDHRYYLNSDDDGIYNATVKLPNNYTCKHCGIRWVYKAGNSWGTCNNGTGAIGCGPQEHFINCADISID